MTSTRRIRRVLIANRGEIAVRIARSLREMGIEVVAVYSEADRSALHLRQADRAVCLGPAPAAESYLDQDKIIAAARSSGADAIHPGYGFLSENATFAARCEKEGLVFIGPTAAAITALGDKARARELAEKQGVPLTPGRRDVLDAEMAATAREVGYPILLKPAAGGGGKGMHRVEERTRLMEAVERARREARSSFGDDRLIVERWVHPARHIEVQVFGDGAGKVVALGERECSLQRRHQKVFEECPSPVVDEELRRRLETAAVDLARAVNYRGAGTVEFLLGPTGEFFFLEMNTRLQVEHPVTELVYGVDLVKAQLAVAEGRGLLPELLAAKRRGHAIEARLYAEDPAKGFLPSPGKVLAYQIPSGPGIRVDSSLDGAGEVCPWYDPMVAKLIVHAATREDAVARLGRALADCALVGLVSNLDFLRCLVGKDWFRQADFHTRCIEERMQSGEELVPADPEIPAEAWALAARELSRAPASSVRGDGGAAGAPDLFAHIGDWTPLGGEPS